MTIAFFQRIGKYILPVLIVVLLTVGCADYPTVMIEGFIFGYIECLFVLSGAALETDTGQIRLPLFVADGDLYSTSRPSGCTGDLCCAAFSRVVAGCCRDKASGGSGYA